MAKSLGQETKWKDKEYLSVYANIMAFSMSQFDISLIFGQIENGSPSELIASPQVKVTLAPEQAANLVRILNVAIETYTNSSGALRTAGAVDVPALKALVEGGQKVN